MAGAAPSPRPCQELGCNEQPDTPTASPEDRVLCLIGDIHGYYDKLQSLWSNLEAHLGAARFSTALCIFLGDYCDRGPQTREVLQFFVDLPTTYPRQRHVFLCGNHDLAFAAFVGVLPPPLDGSAFSDGWSEYAMNEEREGWFKGEGFENMYLQGRRWAGIIRDRWNAVKGTVFQGSIYDAAPTFESYGVPHGSAALSNAVPEAHKKFLANLVWVHEEDNVYIDTPCGRTCCKLIAVHAGLEKSKPVDEQIKRLKSRDTSVPKIEALSGRANVRNTPEELRDKPVIVASGHHSEIYIDGLRLVIDGGGGLEKNPIAALILPSMVLVCDTVSAVKHEQSFIKASENFHAV